MLGRGAGIHQECPQLQALSASVMLCQSILDINRRELSMVPSVFLIWDDMQ